MSTASLVSGEFSSRDDWRLQARSHPDNARRDFASSMSSSLPEHSKQRKNTTGRLSINRLLLFFDAFLGIVLTVNAAVIVKLEPEVVCTIFHDSNLTVGGYATHTSENGFGLSIGQRTPADRWPSHCIGKASESNCTCSNEGGHGSGGEEDEKEGAGAHSGHDASGASGHGLDGTVDEDGTSYLHDFMEKCEKEPTLGCAAASRAISFVIYLAGFFVLSFEVYFKHLQIFLHVEELPMFPIVYLHMVLGMCMAMMPLLVTAMPMQPFEAMWCYLLGMTVTLVVILTMAASVLFQDQKRRHVQRKLTLHRKIVVGRTAICIVSYFMAFIVLSLIAKSLDKDFNRSSGWIYLCFFAPALIEQVLLVVLRLVSPSWRKARRSYAYYRGGVSKNHAEEWLSSCFSAGPTKACRLCCCQSCRRTPPRVSNAEALYGDDFGTGEEGMMNDLEAYSFRTSNFIVGDVVPKERALVFTDGVLAIAATLMLVEMPHVEDTGTLTITHYAEDNSEAIFSALLAIFCDFDLWVTHHRAFDDMPEMLSGTAFLASVAFCFTASLLPLSFDYALYFPFEPRACMMPVVPLVVAGFSNTLVGHFSIAACSFRYSGNHYGLAYDLALPLWAIVLGVIAATTKQGLVWFALIGLVITTKTVVHMCRKGGLDKLERALSRHISNSTDRSNDDESRQSLDQSWVHATPPISYDEIQEEVDEDEELGKEVEEKEEGGRTPGQQEGKEIGSEGRGARVSLADD